MFKPNHTHRILIAEDHDLVIDGYRSLIHEAPEFEIAGVARNGKEVQTFFQGQSCDILILDINMPEMNGIQTISYLKQKAPNVKILVVSMLNSPLLVKKIINLKVQGYLFKTSKADRLLLALREIVKGKNYFEDSIDLESKSRFTSIFVINGKEVVLTSRELEIIRLISMGKSIDQISEELFISAHTVNTHKKNIYLKLDTHNIAELISLVIRHAIIANI